MSLETLKNALESLVDPETGVELAKGKQVLGVDYADGTCHVQVALPSSCSPLFQDFRDRINELVRDHVSEANRIEIQISEHRRPPIPLGQVGLTAKFVVLVGSGKGGVGKSTVALCLALALQKAGCKVGVLDADVYGPSLPQLTGVRGQATKSGEKIGPYYYQGMPLMSIGYLVPPDKAVIWRGPMLHSAVTTFLRDVAWGELDYLIVDMPPGTGDIALTISQSVPKCHAVVVCTPQEVALIDAVKAVAMFQQVKIPVAGVIENMSSFLCPETGKRYDIFGKGGARQYAEDANLPFLGEIPINIGVRERGDSGQTADNFSDPMVAPYLEKIAYQLVRQISQKTVASPVKVQLPVLG